MRKNRMITIGIVLLSAVVAIPLLSGARLWSGWGADASSITLAKNDAEKKILAVIDDIIENQSNAPGRITRTGNARVLRFLVEATNAQSVVEIGTSVGHSALWMLLGLNATGGHLTTFDIDPEAVRHARQNFDNAGVGNRVTIVEGDAHEKYKVISDPIDLVYLDADKGGYLDYLNKLLPLLRPGGIIAADNINMTNQEFRDAITQNPNLETLFLQGDMAVTLKKR